MRHSGSATSHSARTRARASSPTPCPRPERRSGFWSAQPEARAMSTSLATKVFSRTDAQRQKRRASAPRPRSCRRGSSRSVVVSQGATPISMMHGAARSSASWRTTAHGSRRRTASWTLSRAATQSPSSCGPRSSPRAVRRRSPSRSTTDRSVDPTRRFFPIRGSKHPRRGTSSTSTPFGSLGSAPTLTMFVGKDRSTRLALVPRGW